MCDECTKLLRGRARLDLFLRLPVVSSPFCRTVLDGFPKLTGKRRSEVLVLFYTQVPIQPQLLDRAHIVCTSKRTPVLNASTFEATPSSVDDDGKLHSFKGLGWACAKIMHGCGHR